MDVVTQFIMCYVIARLSAAIPRCVILIFISISIMEQKFAYRVLANDAPDRAHLVELFRSNLLDEAVAFALSLYRSCNVSGVEFVVLRNDDAEPIINFIK